MNLNPILHEVVTCFDPVDAVGSVHVYLFGSALQQDCAWADIDILVVCDADEDAELARATLTKVCEIYPVDLLIMTLDEEAEFDFVRSQDCRLLYSKKKSWPKASISLRHR